MSYVPEKTQEHIHSVQLKRLAQKTGVLGTQKLSKDLHDLKQNAFLPYLIERAIQIVQLD